MESLPENVEAKCRAGHTFVTSAGEVGKCWCGELRAPELVKPKCKRFVTTITDVKQQCLHCGGIEAAHR